jgi:integrase
MTGAGVVEPRKNKKKGAGRNARRQSGGLGFHCLRHYCTTALKASGASDVIAREIIGHESAAVSRTYSHIDAATLRAAIDKLPRLDHMSLERFRQSAGFHVVVSGGIKVSKIHLTR